MRIKKIYIKNLFGVFDHEIQLNLKEHITIIHGPNGIGKTIILSMVNGLFNYNFNIFKKIPFNSFSIIFDNDVFIELVKDKKQSSNKEKNYDININLQNEDKETESFNLQNILRKNYKEIDLPFSIITREIPGLDRVGKLEWLYYPTREYLDFDDIILRFGDRLPFKNIINIDALPEKIKKVTNSININFIDTQRLWKLSSQQAKSSYLERFPSLLPQAIITYSEELSNIIRDKLAEYANLSQTLDRSFPIRLVKTEHLKTKKIEDPFLTLNKLEEKRKRLVSAGILDSEQSIDFSEFQHKENINQDVLTTYIEDVENKLKVFDALNEKIEIFKNNINKKFKYKKIYIDKKEGFFIKTDNGNRLSPLNLSSGEQHEIILLYQLLFKVNNNSLILIDEPEISLHIVWQQQFLKDLKKITDIVGFDVLIATHSPQIIHDRWDLTVQLRGPNNEK